jgi:hypothetical protein
MSDKICIPKSYFVIILLIFVGFTYMHTIRMSNIIYKSNNKVCPSPKIIIKEKDNSQELKDMSREIEELKHVSKSNKDLLMERDRKVVDDNFKPPERRVPRHNYPVKAIKNLMNISTRGYPDNFQNLGMLVRKNDEKILKLFGRQKFPGSNQWEYYVLNTETYDKVPLEIPGNKELSNNDVIGLPWLDQSKGKFDIKMFDYDAPRYNPYL